MPMQRRIPIRVKQQVLEERPRPAAPLPVVEAAPPVVEAGEPLPPLPEAGPAEKMQIEETQDIEGTEELERWKDRALRLEAEMDNFRKRQQRLAEDRIAADRERLLRAFLTVADDLARALSANGADPESLRQGVDITYQSLMRILDREGVETIQARGRPFDPSWHEAVGTVSHQEVGAEPETVVEVVQPGYRIGDRLLRPARVIVAT